MILPPYIYTYIPIARRARHLALSNRSFKTQPFCSNQARPTSIGVALHWVPRDKAHTHDVLESRIFVESSTLFSATYIRLPWGQALEPITRPRTVATEYMQLFYTHCCKPSLLQPCTAKRAAAEPSRNAPTCLILCPPVAGSCRTPRTTFLRRPRPSVGAPAG